MDPADRTFKIPLPPNFTFEPTTPTNEIRMDDHGTRSARASEAFLPIPLSQASLAAASNPQAQPQVAKTFRPRPTRTNAHQSQSTSTNTAPPVTITTQDSTSYQGHSGTPQNMVNGSEIKKMANVFRKQLFSTPKKKTTHRDYFKDGGVFGQGKSIMSTMAPAATPFSYAWITKVFVRGTNLRDSSVRKWLSDEEVFYFGTGNNSRWTIVPKNPSLESDLYIPLVNLVGTVLYKFLKRDNNNKRAVFDMHSTQLTHEEGHRTSPDIIVAGKGPSFEKPSSGNEVGYGNIVTFLEVKQNGAVKKPENIEQTAVYARQMFIHQPNRWFVRALIISHEVVQLVHWDRAGAQKSSFYSIHDNYMVFIGLLVGLCNTENEQHSIGLDQSIQWSHDEAGAKTSGQMTEVCDDETKVFPLRDFRPVSFGRQIDGSATVYWKVLDPTAKVIVRKNLIVKDSWSSPGRTEEWKLLDRANTEGVRGICKMIYHKDRRAKISDFREGDEFFDRLFSRIVMEEYGNEIDQFMTAVQFLAALRDGVAAHGNLYGIGILHRDISHKTILLGREGAEIGEQGILIDLSGAFDFYRDAGLEISMEPVMGPRFYQSCTILEFLTDMNEDDMLGYAPAHDYLDDMESFFDVFCHVMFEFLPNGARRADEDKARLFLEDWDHVSPRTARAAKLVILDPTCRENERAKDCIEDSWGLVCANLFEKYSNWMRDIRTERTRLLRRYEKRIREMIKKSGQLAQKPASDAQHPEAQQPVVEQPNAPKPHVSQSGSEQLNSPQPSVEKPGDQKSEAQEVPEESYESVFADLYAEAESHYKDVVNMIHEAILALEDCPANSPAPPPVKIPQGRRKGKAPAKRPRAKSTGGGGSANKVIKLFHPRSRQSSMAGGTSRPQFLPSTSTSMDTSA